MRKLVSMEEARELIASVPAAPKTEYVPLSEALDRVLAEDVRAEFPMPPFDKSPFDGYAFRACDVPGTLRVSGEIAAGGRPAGELKAGEAVRIFTGAPTPAGADAVIKAEETEHTGDAVTVSRAFRHDENVIKSGEEYELGALLISAGEKLTPPLLGVAASQGAYRLPVYKRPRAAIISTGSELAEAGEERSEYGIYNSSVHAIGGYLARMGFEVIPAGTVEDDGEVISALVSELLHSDADVVITTGGASVGDYDFAVSTAQNVGADILFWKVNMKPGGALLAAEKNGKLLLSLSGNPAAALMSLLTVAQPYFRSLTGLTFGGFEEITLPLKYPLPKVSSCTRLLRGNIEFESGGAFFAEHTGRGNGNIASFRRCDAIGVIPGNAGELPAGALIRVLRLPCDIC